METTFEDRLNDEKNELEVKISKLSVFLESEKAKEISDMQHTLLNIQLKVMLSYHRILIARLEELDL